jgi:hypothetical protein
VAGLLPRCRRLSREERGSALIESIGLLPYLLLAALASWQMLLVAATVTAAEQAARVGSRVAAAGGDGTAAALEALPAYARAGPARVETGAGTGAEAAPCPEAAPAPAPSPGTGGRAVDACRALGAGAEGGRVRVTVGTPVLVPGLSTDALTITRSADFPPSAST